MIDIYYSNLILPSFVLYIFLCLPSIVYLSIFRADKNIPTNKGEVAAQLTSEGVIKVLLNAMKGGSGGGDTKPAVSNGSPAPAKAAIKVG